MTEVSFYTGIADRLGFVCRLLRKAQASGARISVVGPAPLLRRLDAALWSFEPEGFVPHLRLEPGAPPPPALAHTPILLCERVGEPPHGEVLLNIGAELPEGWQRFARVLEVVSLQEEQVQAGRERFRQYKEAGLPVQHFVAGGG